MPALGAGADGILYGVPDSSTEVRSPHTSLGRPPLLTSLGDTWQVLRITPATSTRGASVDTIGADLGVDTVDGKWIGAILGANGCIYAIPFNATRVLKIDPTKGEVCANPSPDPSPNP